MPSRHSRKCPANGGKLKLALRFDAEAGTWTLLGEAAEYALGETRREIRDTVAAHGALTPKQLSTLTSITHENARQAMARMAKDGQLVADSGTYRTPVTPVTGSLSGDVVTGVTGVERGIPS